MSPRPSLRAALLACAIDLPAAAADDEAPPAELAWEFGADLIGAGFFNSGAYFGNDAVFLGDEIGTWFEFGVEPKASFRVASGKGELFGAFSLVGTYTSGDDASGLTIGIQDPAEVTLEQAHLGWKAQDVVGWMEGETFTVQVGSFDYSIGTGLLINDGGSDGGERGGWYLGMRKTFQEALLVRLEDEDTLLEGFKLANRPRAGGTQGDALGVNLEQKFAEVYELGGTLMSVDDNLPGSDALTVVSARFDRTPEQGFGFRSELVVQQSDQIEADGWFVQLSYAPKDMGWSPQFSYRHASFSGDDPLTAEDEGFRSIAYGFTDYGTWYQGEITGNYPLGNGNLKSHMLRAKMQPGEDLTLNVLYYQFTFDQPAAFGLTSDDWGDEIDVTLDWAWSDQLYLIGVLGILSPGAGAVQMTGGSDDWVYTMLYASYAW